MNEKKQLIKNAFTSVVQVIIVSASLFILYKYLLNPHGVEKLGAKLSVTLPTGRQVCDTSFSFHKYHKVNTKTYKI